jgi:hypothetical protein
MRSFHFLVLSFSFALICSGANAQQLPKSGTIDMHTGWKDTGEAFEVASKQMQGHGTVVGTSFNDKGSGPLHMGPAMCQYTFFAADSGAKNKGYCSFGDQDGDRIFTDFDGAATTEGSEGVNRIVGGTGKYAGIKGNGTWKSRSSGPNGQFLTVQHFEYKLP